MFCHYYKPEIEILLCRRRRTSDWKVTTSFNVPFWRFFLNCSESVEMFFKNVKTISDPGSFVLIPPETDFKAVTITEFEQFYVHFLLAYPYDRCTPGIYKFPVSAQLLVQIEQISSILKTEESNPSTRLSLLISSLCLNALTFMPENSIRQDLRNGKIIKLLKYIDKNLTTPIGNEELALQVNMGINAFTRFFKNHTGMTSQNYIQDRKIRKACAMLRFSDKAIDEIAMETGFSDRYYFSRVFKKVRGTGPAEFRKNHV